MQSAAAAEEKTEMYAKAVRTPVIEAVQAILSSVERVADWSGQVFTAALMARPALPMKTEERPTLTTQKPMSPGSALGSGQSFLACATGSVSGPSPCVATSA